LGVIWLSLTIN